MKWHDGTPFTAEDVKYTLELINTPGFRVRNRVGHSLVQRHRGRRARRDLLAHGEGLLALSLDPGTTFIVPKHILEKASDPNTAPFNNAPVGTGPFRWGERVAGDHILLSANESYHGDGPLSRDASSSNTCPT